MPVVNPLANAVVTETECIEWQGQLSKGGYGKTMFMGKTWAAHRKSYYLANGGIPDGMCVLHKCDNRKCINPDHLFAGTSKDNAIDRERKGRGAGNLIRQRTTHCKNGHEYTPENTYLYRWDCRPNAAKQCRTCIRERVANYKRKKKLRT